MIPPNAVEIVQGTIFHTPRNPFSDPSGLEAIPNGALALEGGRILQCGDHIEILKAWPGARSSAPQGGYILPGLIDTHVHFPQVRIVGGLGYSLLDWLEKLTLPEEARLADVSYAETLAVEFTQALASHGTTTALVFGAHFPAATAALFEASERAGLRVFSGLVLSDRSLRPDLLQTPEQAYGESKALIARFHGKVSGGYAVTPRFALSASEAMLEVCQTLLKEDASLRFTTHINEDFDEIAQVKRAFPWAADYLGVYEKFDLVGSRSVLAHNIHSSGSALQRLAASKAAIAHCPSSNAALGSGIFPLGRHLVAGVRVALGTDVGGGTGFGMLKEALQAYLMQRVAPEPYTLTPGQMLYLATRAGAEALGIEDETGDFASGKSADFIRIRPEPGSHLNVVLRNAASPENALAAMLTLAGADSISEVYAGGSGRVQGIAPLHPPTPPDVRFSASGG